VAAIIWFFLNIQGKWSHILYYPILLGFNVLVLFCLGVLIIRAIVFPYSFWGSRNAIIGSNCIHYGEEFATLVEKSYVLMRIHMMKLIEEQSHAIETAYVKEKLLKFKKSNLPNYENCYINQKMKSVVGLSIMYADTNQIVISQKSKRKERMNRLIEELATVHRGIAMIFQKLDCEIKDSFNRPMEMSFAEYYKESQSDFCEYRVP
jgi:hypothetical protein